MGLVGTQFRELMATTTTITAVVNMRIHQDHMPQGSNYPAIWFSRAEEMFHRSLESTRRVGTRFDVECMSTSIATAQDLAERTREVLDGYRGAMGSMTAQGIFVEDKSDDYVFRNDASDHGVEIAALDVSVWTQDT